jgi:hypothetical protein
MTLVSLTIRRKREKLTGSAKNFSSEAQVYNDTRIISAVPSICKKDGTSDGLVNSLVTIDQNEGSNTILLWCTETVSAVAALS